MRILIIIAKPIGGAIALSLIGLFATTMFLYEKAWDGFGLILGGVDWLADHCL